VRMVARDAEATRARPNEGHRAYLVLAPPGTAWRETVERPMRSQCLKSGPGATVRKMGAICIQHGECEGPRQSLPGLLATFLLVSPWHAGRE
jgi:hypothetical protein